MSDFIREVDEEYRRDKAMAFLSRYQVLIAIAFVAIIAGAGGYRFWIDRQVSNAEAVNNRFMAASDLAKDGKAEQAEAAFGAIGKDGPSGYAMLSRMRAAASLQARDPEGAAKAFDAIASEDTLPASMRDAARVRGAMIRIGTEEPKAFEQRYGRFAEPGFVFASSMRELLALAALKRQDFATAGRYLDQIVIDPNAPAALRGRAQAFRTLVIAGPATQMATQPPPMSVNILPGSAKPPAPAAPPTQQPAAPNPATPNPTMPSPTTPSPTTPSPTMVSPTTASPTTASPPAPSSAAPPAPVPPAVPAKPEAVPPSIKPPGTTPPD